MWGVLLQMMVSVLNGVEPSIYSPTRTVHGDLNLVGGETVLCMPPCNRLKRWDRVATTEGAPALGCGRTTGGRVAGSSLGPDPSRCYGWIQFGVLVGFSIYLWFVPFLNILSWSAHSRVFCVFPRVIPEIHIFNKTCGKVSSKPYHLFILFIKMMFIIIR